VNGERDCEISQVTMDAPRIRTLVLLFVEGDPGQTSNFLRIPFAGLSQPYTADDVFAFAPNYWNQISVEAAAL